MFSFLRRRCPDCPARLEKVTFTHGTGTGCRFLYRCDGCKEWWEEQAEDRKQLFKPDDKWLAWAHFLRRDGSKIVEGDPDYPTT